MPLNSSITLTTGEQIAGLAGGDGVDTILMAGSPTFTMSAWTASTSGFQFMAVANGQGLLVANPIHLDFSGLTQIVFPGENGFDTLSVLGSTGDDVITAWDTGATLNGNDGNDILNGGAGNDTLDGGDGDDVLNGNGGDDILDSGAGVNTLNGGAGNDTLTSYGSNDTLNGGPGDDRITFNGTAARTVTIDGGDGNDTISVNGGIGDVVAGGAGDDSILLSGASVATLAGGSGVDTLSLGGFVNLDMAVFSAASSGIENLGVGREAYSFNGDGNADVLDFSGFALSVYAGGTVPGVIVNGLGGDDVITGTASDDLLSGGDGNDTINPGGGIDTVSGGDGDDTINMGANFSVSDTIDGGAGFNTLTLAGDYSAGIPGAGGGPVFLSNIEDVVLGAGFSYSLNFIIRGNSSMMIDASTLGAGDSLVFTGAGQHDGPTFVVDGGAGADTLTGGFGADTLSGGAGSDTLIGGPGADSLAGGLGIDTAAYAAAAAQATIARHGDGTWTVSTSADGADTAGSVELLRFADRSISLVAELARWSDFAGDGRSDLLIENHAGAVVIGEAQNGQVAYQGVAALGPEWTFREVGDFLGDGFVETSLPGQTTGQAQFLIENAGGAVVAAEITAGVASYTQVASLGPEWKFVGVGDFLLHGDDQFLIENGQGAVDTGEVLGGVATFTQVAALGSEWTFVDAGDFVGDGRSAFLIENASGAVDVGEVGASGTAAYTQLTALGPEWKFVGSGDFLGETHAQFLIENGLGAIDVGDWSGGQIHFTQVAALGPEWKFVGAGDYLGEGHDQFLIENTAGAVFVGDWSGGSIHYTQVTALGGEWAFH